MLKLHVFDELTIWNADCFRLPATYILDSKGSTLQLTYLSKNEQLGKLPPGTYNLTEIRDSEGRLWWLVDGSIYGAYPDTWMSREEARLCRVESAKQSISLEEFVRQTYQRELATDLGRGRFSFISLLDRRIVEQICLAKPASDESYPGQTHEITERLNEITLGYLPVEAKVDWDGSIILHNPVDGDL